MTGALPSAVLVTLPRHPLEGRELEVLGRMRRHGRLELLLAVPGSGKRLIPAEWTSLHCGTAEQGGGGTLGSVPDLLAASALVSAFSARGRPEREQAARQSPAKEDNRAAGLSRGKKIEHPPAVTLIAPALQAFFTDRLARQRQASPQTIAAYRDTMRLLLIFVQQRTGKPPQILDWDDLTADVISAFLSHLEDERGNSVRTRNLRLTAIRSLFHFAALQHPEHALLIARVLDIPPKRSDKRIITFLTGEEADALLAAPDAERWEGGSSLGMSAPGPGNEPAVRTSRWWCRRFR